MIAYYQEKEDGLLHKISELKSKLTKLSFLRLMSFMALLIIISLSFTKSIILGFASLILGVTIFLYIVKRYLFAEKKLQQHENELTLTRNEIRCLSEYQNIYPDGTAFAEANHPYAIDLDVIGPNSLFAILNRCITESGNRNLAQFLTKIEEREKILQRREAVQEIAENTRFRNRFLTCLWDEKELLSENGSGESLYDTTFLNPIAVTAINILPILWLAILALYFSGILYASAFASILFVVTFLTYIGFAKKINRIHAIISNLYSSMGSLYEASSIVYNETFTASFLQEIKGKNEESKKFSTLPFLKEIADLVAYLDYRLNFIVGIFLNIFCLWDFRIIRKIILWDEKHRPEISELVDRIGKLEAISSLATWSFNHPDYIYAHLISESFHLEGNGLKHPLLELQTNVPNDLLKPQESLITIVTGSNMAGKSTWLRTCGINMILAYAGTVSAADALTISVNPIMTYMRIKDALEENVSTFKAELNRISMMLQQITEEPFSLLLIDEMLRGTNSVDKLQGSIAITKKIIQSKAYAMIATHDLKLADLQKEYPDSIVNYYFDIAFANDELLFDYKIKPGICTNFNASFLLKKLGL